MSERGRVAFLFAPGAGAGASSAWMTAWGDRLRRLGEVTAFDYPYRLAGRRAPDRPPVLEAAHRRALLEAQAARPPLHRSEATSWFLAGKSMGSRIGCHVAATDPALVRGLICFGYPLVAAGSGAVRDQVLLALRTPILFIQGTRDPLCPLDRLRAVCALMTAPHEIVEVHGGDHSLETTRRPRGSTAGAQGPTEEASTDALLGHIGDFVARNCGLTSPLLA